MGSLQDSGSNHSTVSLQKNYSNSGVTRPEPVFFLRFHQKSLKALKKLKMFSRFARKALKKDFKNFPPLRGGKKNVKR